MRFLVGFATSTALVALLWPGVASAQTSETSTADQNSFGLGEIIVTGQRVEGVAIGADSIGQEAIFTFNRASLDEAASLIPGVTASNTGGSRNERLIFVRGFDRYQVPVSIDGIRVYLPYDNRLDYGRFLTADVAQIQVAKGYVSVLDGPGALGGAINLVTTKPARKIEGEARVTLNLDRDADYAGYTAYGRLGTAHEKWYAQASFARNFQDHWDLAGSFTPTATQERGARGLSRTEDWRLNLKAGFTPNANDEYALSYTRQEGAKNAPFHISSPQAQSWAWPYWNLDSIYFLSTTALSDQFTLKGRAFRNTFGNLLRGFDDRSQTTQTLTAGRVFNSWYEEESYGGSVQLDYATGSNRLGVAFHYRHDGHVEYSQVFPTGFIEPPQPSVEETFSIAIEDTLQVSPTLSVTVGASYDWRNLIQSDEFVLNGTRNGGTPLSYPLADADAWNAQGRINWCPDADSDIHLSLSSRTRFPTLAERFSSRFGGATSNPELNAERATSLELGASKRWGSARVEGAVFYSWLDDAIVSFPFIYNNTAVSQSRNVGKGEYYGVEFAVTAPVSATLTLGANYTWLHRDFADPSVPAFEATGVPTHKAFAWAEWAPLQRLSVVPSIELVSDRWTTNPAGSVYYRTGSYVQAGLRVDYELINGLVVGAGVKNAFDDNYQLVDGFPEAGRSFFVSLRARY